MAWTYEPEWVSHGISSTEKRLSLYLPARLGVVPTSLENLFQGLSGTATILPLIENGFRNFHATIDPLREDPFGPLSDSIL